MLPTQSTAYVGRLEATACESDLLFLGSRSVLVERGQVRFLLSWAEGDGLCVAVDGQVILPRLEILVALILGSLGPVQGTLEEEAMNCTYLLTRGGRKTFIQHSCSVPLNHSILFR